MANDESTESIGCGFFFQSIIIPVLSFALGYSGIDRVYAGDWKLGGAQMVIFIYGAYAISSTGNDTLEAMLFYMYLITIWSWNLINTTRFYRRRFGVEVGSPSPKVALFLALFLGFTGTDRFYLNDTIIGILKSCLFVSIAYLSLVSDADLKNPLTGLISCWWLCDVIMSPLRARCL